MKKIDIEKITNILEDDEFEGTKDGNPIKPIIIHWTNNYESLTEMTKDLTTEQVLALVVESHKAVRSNISLLAELFKRCSKISQINRKIVDRIDKLEMVRLDGGEENTKLVKAYRSKKKSDLKKIITAYYKLSKFIQNEYSIAIRGSYNTETQSNDGGLKNLFKEIRDNHKKIVDSFILIDWIVNSKVDIRDLEHRDLINWIESMNED